MKRYVISAAFFLASCSTNSTPVSIDLAGQDTLTLCRALSSGDQAFQARATEILLKRGATVDKCNRLVSADNAIAVGIVAAGAIAATGAGASNGGYHPPSVYGVAWDGFRNQWGQVVWRCRSRATGQFVDDYHCYGMPFSDYTWPGPYI